MSDAPIRINIGAGDSPIDGYDNSYDLKQGKKAFPLDLPENSVDEIRCSHTLEHFACDWIPIILKDWVRCLKPGGLLKIAVPDFEVIAGKYVADAEGQYQGWVHGGQLDTNDFHFTLFDFDILCACLRDAGLVGLHKWGFPGEQDMDSSRLEVSLNIAAYKPLIAYPKTLSVMSAPRLGFMDQFMVASDALLPLGIPTYTRTGAYWAQCMAKAIQDVIDDGAEYILTLDYDTLFQLSDVQDLLAFMVAKPDADALVSMQIHRNNGKLLMNAKTEHVGNVITFDELEATYFPIKTGHFGASLFRASALKKLPRPWFFETPDKDGAYGAGHIDADVQFWLNFEKAGCNAYMVPRVVVGHIEPFVLWPDRKLKETRQRIGDWRNVHRPKDAWR